MGKKILAILLCLVTVLPLAACGAVGDDVAGIAPEALMEAEALTKLSTENSTYLSDPLLPALTVAELDTLSAYEQDFPGKTPEESDAIWAWAHQVVAEWYERYQEHIAESENATVPDGFTRKDSEYNTTVHVFRKTSWIGTSNGSFNKTRTLSALEGWASSDWAKKESVGRTEFGGFIDEENKQTATGFFYVKKLGGRWFLIDPLGYPTIMTALQGVVPVYNENATQKEWVNTEFGSEEKWAVSTTLRLNRTHGIYGSTGFLQLGDLLYDVPEGLVNVSCAGPGISDYCIEKGIAINAGSTYFGPEITYATRSTACQVMPVFERDFLDYLDEAGKTQLAPYANEPRIMAWSCANETPIKLNMLYRYLHYIDPAYMESNPDVFPHKEKNACYYDTFAVTVTWMRFMTGEMNIATGDAVSEADLSADLSALFLGFIYDHLLFHCRETYKKYVPNHLFLGIRWLSNGDLTQDPAKTTDSIMQREWAARLASRYCDVVAINWYKNYNASSETYREFTTWTQDKPVMMTEFNGWAADYAEDYDAEGAEKYSSLSGLNRANGFTTKADRAKYFEHLTLDWLEWHTVVGWSWYRYNHYIKGTVVSSVTGILSDDGVYDPYLEESMGNINHMAYYIARFLHERHQ